jgi:hypothetical protein
LIGLAVAAMAIIATGTARFFKKHHDSAQKRSINRLLESSRQHEHAGDLNQALIELDAALDLAQQASPAGTSEWADYQEKRRSLSHREVEATLERLLRRDQPDFPLGGWLNLIARLPRDHDLASFVDPINKQFEASIPEEVDSQLKAARRSFEAGRVVESSQRCDRIAELLNHLGPKAQATIRSETEKLVNQLVVEHGLTIQEPHGTFIFGSKAGYVSELMPILAAAFESKGYLPSRDASPWRHAWSQASYHVRLDVSERLEGSYLSTQNRLTRIEVRLSLTSPSGALLWQISPTARSSVPLPELSTYISSRLAAIQTRSEEIEKLLHANARGQIKERFRRSLGTMPDCPRAIPR